jgi:ABC-type lipoprotein release transport system permease subunit
MVQGAASGVIGTLAGVGSSVCCVAFNIDVIVPFIESAAAHELPAEQHLPDQPHAERAAVGRHPAHRR